jgi:hypothetical protein
MIRPSGGQPPVGLVAPQGLATLRTYLVFSVMLFLNMVCLTVAPAIGKEVRDVTFKTQKFLWLFCRPPSLTDREGDGQLQGVEIGDGARPKSYLIIISDLSTCTLAPSRDS